VPHVWPLLAVTAEVETVSVAPAQPEGGVSSAGMSESREAWAKSWTLGPCEAQVESSVSCGVRRMLARRSDRWEHGLAVSSDQRREPWGNPGHRQWCKHGSRTESIILQKHV
jgi:hypothetical protein